MTAGERELLGILDRIDRKKAMLDGMRPLTEGESARLAEEFAVEYTYNSNAIEGNTLTLRETDMVLRGLTIAQKPLKDHMEAVGHREAPIDIKFADRVAYYRAFDECHENNNAIPMAKLFAGYLDETLDRYLRILAAHSPNAPKKMYLRRG